MVVIAKYFFLLKVEGVFMRIRILVVDDDSMMRRFLFHALTQAGYEVNTASNGVEAISMLKQEKYHLIITDYMMPQLNGTQLIEWIRLRDSLIPVILMSGSREDINFNSESMAFLKKPFDLSELKSTVSVLLKRKKTAK